MKLTALTLSDGSAEVLPLITEYVTRQTRPVEWHLSIEKHDAGSKGAVARHMARALREIPEDHTVVVMEHDDWYGADYIERMERGMWMDAGRGLYAPKLQRHYHVAGYWHSVDDCPRCVRHGAGINLTYTAIAPSGREHAIIVFDGGKVDCHGLWGGEMATLEPLPVVAIKGIPGTGVSTKHSVRMSTKRGHRWNMDPGGEVLEQWTGEDAETYRQWARVPSR